MLRDLRAECAGHPVHELKHTPANRHGGCFKTSDPEGIAPIENGDFDAVAPETPEDTCIGEVLGEIMLARVGSHKTRPLLIGGTLAPLRLARPDLPRAVRRC